MLATVNQILGLGTIILQALILSGALYYLWRRSSSDRLIKLIADYALWAALVIAWLATLGSLYYSEIAGFAPCQLCWFQRIAIYPQIVLLWVAAVRQDGLAKLYSLPLLCIGLLISLYHNYIYYNPPAVTMCSAAELSCTNKVVTIYGYISIPLMAATVLVAMGLLVLVARPRR